MKKIFVFIGLWSVVLVQAKGPYDPEKSTRLANLKENAEEIKRAIAAATVDGWINKKVFEDNCAALAFNKSLQDQDRGHYECLQSMKELNSDIKRSVESTRAYSEEIRSQRLAMQQQEERLGVISWQADVQLMIGAAVVLVCGLVFCVVAPKIVRYFKWRLKRSATRRMKKKYNFEGVRNAKSVSIVAV